MSKLTLAARVRQGALPLSVAAPVIDDVLAEVAQLHARGMVDRTLTAERVLVDFGAQRPRASLRELPHEPRSAIGATPDSATLIRSFSFMAPEQVRGAASVDARADIYAIGALAFVALTGKLPFAETNALVGIARKLERPPPTLESAVGTPFSPLIELFVATAMASDREQRYSRIEVARAAWRNACEMAE